MKTTKNVAGTVAEIKEIEARLEQIDQEKDVIDNTPSAWTNFFSGSKLKPTPTTKRRIDRLASEASRLNAKLITLLKVVTVKEAEAHGYNTEGCDEELFAAE